MTNFYTYNGLERQGPFTLEQLRDQKIAPSLMVWKEGFSEWKRADQVPELSILFPKFPDFPEEPRLKATAPQAPESFAYSAGHAVTKRRTWVIAAISILLFVVIAGFVLNKRSQSSMLLQSAGLDFEESRQRNIRSNWNQFIHKGNLTYSAVGLGGIQDLQIEVTNNSDYSLDEVKVEFEYIKANGGSYKREEITLTHLPAHSSRTVSGPNSSRGTSVRAKITSITAKDFNFCYREYGSAVAGMEDPWRCNR